MGVWCRLFREIARGEKKKAICAGFPATGVRSYGERCWCKIEHTAKRYSFSQVGTSNFDTSNFQGRSPTHSKQIPPLILFLVETRPIQGNLENNTRTNLLYSFRPNVKKNSPRVIFLPHNLAHHAPAFCELSVAISVNCPDLGQASQSLNSQTHIQHTFFTGPFVLLPIKYFGERYPEVGCGLILAHQRRRIKGRLTENVVAFEYSHNDEED